MRTTARLEIGRGATGDPGPLAALTGIRPKDLEDVLAAEPASVQERWFARLYFLKPVVFATLSLFWIATGIVSLGPGWSRGVALLAHAELSGPLAGLLIIAGGVADILIGAAIAVRRTARLGLFAGIAVSLCYAIVATVLLPELWREPLGPLLKIWPILVLMAVALAMRDSR